MQTTYMINTCKAAFLVCLVSLSSLCLAQFDETPYQVKNFKLSNDGRLKVETVGGNIEITGQSSNEAKVEMYVRGNNSNDDLSESEIKERLENYDVQINQEGNTVNAIVTQKKSVNWNRNGLSISFRIHVPRQIATNLETKGGNIELSNLTGKQDVITRGGNIDVRKLTGDTRLETAGGNIGIEGFDGKLQVTCSGGNIDLNNAKGEISVKTAGGNITLAGAAGSIEAHTSGGDIRAKITAMEKSLTLSSSGGNITASLPENKGFDVDIRADRVHTNFANFKGSLGKEKVQGTVNAGGIPVKMTTSGGNISLN
jgi:hypothetical protein